MRRLKIPCPLFSSFCALVILRRNTLRELTPTQWETVKRIFAVALAEPRAARVAIVRAACAGDTQVETEVWELLSADEEISGFLKGGW
jgi:hypothetical protein